MIGETQSTVSENLYIYTARIDDSPHPTRAATIVFMPHANTSAEIVRPALITYLDNDPTAHEVWFVTHHPYRAQLSSILHDHELHARSAGRPLRGFAISSAGSWTEHNPFPQVRLIDADVDTISAVIAAGLRRQFCDTKSLLTAYGQFHFGKPGGAHSKNFLRAQPAVARDAHAHFVAAALLSHLDVEHVRRVWIDTGGITSVAGALGAVRAAHFAKAPQLLVDSFGGYDGLASVSSSMAASDAVIISSSTSGSLARRIRDRTSVPEHQIATLYFVAGRTSDTANVATSPPAAPPGIVCDLTLRSTDRDDSYVAPFVTYPNGHCVYCAGSEPAVPLEGDGFLPVTGTLTPRPIVITDGTAELNDFVRIAMPHGALRVRHAAHGRGVRTVGTALTPLLAVPAFAERMTAMLTDLARHSPRRPHIDHVLHTDGDDSAALAEHLRTELPHVKTEPVSATAGIPALENAGAALPRHILIVCAVASSGRTLLDISRRLRFLPETTALSYLIAVAHPESEYAWKTATGSLKKRAAKIDNGYVEGWKVYRETLRTAVGGRSLKNADHDRESDTRWSSSDPWDKESALIDELIAQLYGDATHRTFLIERAAELVGMPQQQSPKRLFLGSRIGANHDGLPSLNNNFVYWNFPWHRGGATEELVYWTITSVLQHNRWRNSTASQPGQYLHVSTGGHFFVIEPMMFDRFNDPVIQASILRAAASGELDYTTDGPRSRFMRDLIVDAARNARTERGAAINEYLLSLAMGMYARDGRHLRLKPAELQGLVADLNGLPLGTLGTLSMHLISLLAPPLAALPTPVFEDLDQPF